MIIYESLEEYVYDAKIGDKIVIERSWDLNKLRPNSRHDTFTVVDIFRGNLTTRRYQSKTRELIEVEGEVGLLSVAEYKALRKGY